MDSNPRSAVDTRAEAPATPDPRRWRILALLGIAQFMLIVDVTVVAIALPHIGADLGLTREPLTWVVSAYTLAFGGLMLLGGRTADLVGPRAVVLTGLSVFTLASMVAGLADTGAVLIAARVAQGIGAAMLSPAALSTVVRLFDGDERTRALGIWSALGGGGAAVGVLVGGALTGGPGWPWVFFVNVPVGVVVLLLLIRLLPRLAAAPAGMRARLDVLGAVLVTAGTGFAIYALIGAGDRGWLSGATLGLVAAAVALYLAFGWWQRAAAQPLVDPGLLRRRPVAAGTFVVLVGTALMVAVFFLGSFYLQQHAQLDPFVTGLLFLPVAIATMAGASVAGRIIGPLGARPVGVVAMVLAAVGLIVPVVWTGTVGTVIGVTVAGLGIGPLFVVASATALGQVAPHEAGVASGVVSTFHEFGAALGAAVVSSAAAASLAGAATGASGTTSGFDTAFLVAAGVAVVSAVLAGTWIPPRPARS